MGRTHQIMGYKVMATLGQGAKSTIFAVEDKKHNVFALKRVIKESPQDQRFVDQAILEHQIASKLDHPSIRKSFKLIRQRKVLRTSEIYVLMELVDGMTLEQHKPEEVLELCLILQKVADGLSSFHEAGFVHADLKPNNLMVDDKMNVKIIDFGQSCPIGTVKPRIQGTPEYIAPEQVKRRQIVPATDVYNLGATMYWLLANKHVPNILPKGDVTVEMRSEEKIQPPSELNPLIPPALSSLIMGCIRYKIEDRPSSMGQVRQRLEMAISQMRKERSKSTSRAG